jgi:DNA topoisomerase-1
MAKHFTSLVSVDFTANMEDRLDHIEDAKTDWVQMLDEFYGPFKSTLDQAELNIEEMKGILDEVTDIDCELCGRKMVKKLGKYGFFLACQGFPECRNAKSLPLGKCPLCGDGDVVKRSSKKGKGGAFYACSKYPDCAFFTRDNPTDSSCPKCGRLLFKKSIKGKGEKHICLNESCGYQVELLDPKYSPTVNGQNSNGNGQNNA